jgi:hypothetical protein
VIQTIVSLQLLLGLVVGFGIGYVVVGLAARRTERLFRSRAIRDGVAAELAAREVEVGDQMVTDPAPPATTPSPAGFEHDAVLTPARRTSPYVAPALH